MKGFTHRSFDVSAYDVFVRERTKNNKDVAHDLEWDT
jgi:hypothetical protein